MPRSVLHILYCSFKPRTAMSGRNSSPFLHEKKLRHREGATLVSGYTTTSGHQHSNRQTGSGTQRSAASPAHTDSHSHIRICFAHLKQATQLECHILFSYFSIPRRCFANFFKDSSAPAACFRAARSPGTSPIWFMSPSLCQESSYVNTLQRTFLLSHLIRTLLVFHDGGHFFLVGYV